MMATVVAIERVLSKTAIDIEECRHQLHGLTEQRAYLASIAVERGMSHRKVAELLDVSHTAVQKMLRPMWSFRNTTAADRALADADRSDLRKQNREKLRS